MKVHFLFSFKKAGLALLLLSAFVWQASGQCLVAVEGQWPSATFTPTCTGTSETVTTAAWTSEYSRVNVVSGNVYTFTSSNATHYITISNGNGSVAYAWGTTPLNWTASFTGEVRFYTHLSSACNGAQIIHTRALSCSAGGPPPPSGIENDLCADALPISCGQTVSGTTVGATFDNVGTCGISNTSPGVWYTFTGVGRNARVSTCGSSFDTKLSVFSGSCGALVCVAGNDDACGLQSTVEFSAEPGVKYFVLVHGFGSATGSFQLSLVCGIPPVMGCTDPTALNYNPNATIDDGSCVYPPPPPPGPANDLCANATLIGCGQTLSGSNLSATGTGQPTAFCGTSPGSFGVWYRYVGTGEIVTVSTCNPGTDFDTKLNVYSGSCGSLVCVGGNDDTADPSCQLPPNNFNRKSRVTFTSTAGTTYYFLVTGFSTLRGNFDLTVTCAPAIIPGCTDPNAVNYNPNATVDNGSCIYPPANDLCANAASISCGQTLSGTTLGASVDNAGTCGVSNTSPGVWYTFLGAGRSVTLSTCNQANFDTKISVFSGSCGNLVCVGGNDDASGCGLTSRLTVPAAPGVQYYVLVHGFGSATGNFSLTLTCGVNPIVQQDPGQTVSSGKISLFPNPAQDVVNVKVSDFMGRTAIATVFNNVGQMVTQRNLGEIQIPTERIELGNLPSGVYYLSLNVEGEGVFTEKFLVNGNRP